jgi:hypothetical protein
MPQTGWRCWWVRAGMVLGGERVWGALAKRKWAGCAGNSPAIHGWEKAGASGQSPGRDGSTVLSSLRDSLAWLGGVPSTEVLGYFQAAPVFAGRWASGERRVALGRAEGGSRMSGGWLSDERRVALGRAEGGSRMSGGWLSDEQRVALGRAEGATWVSIGWSNGERWTV